MVTKVLVNPGKLRMGRSFYLRGISIEIKLKRLTISLRRKLKDVVLGNCSMFFCGSLRNDFFQEPFICVLILKEDALTDSVRRGLQDRIVR